MIPFYYIYYTEHLLRYIVMIKWLKMNNETKNHNPINLKKKKYPSFKKQWPIPLFYHLVILSNDYLYKC